MLNIGFDAKRYYLNRTGLGNYSRDLIRILEEYYPENSYIKYTPKIDEFWFGSSLFKETTKLPSGRFNTIFPNYWRHRSIVKDLVKDGIQIFHGLSGEIPKGLHENNIKSVVTIHDLIFLKFPELYRPIDRWIYNQKSKHALKNADKIVAISKQTKYDIIQYYGIDANKIDVIYQGCHPAFKTTKTEAEKQAIREKYNLPEQFILNVGSIEPRKNALQIVKAIENIDIPLLIIGKETSYSDQIKSYVHEHGLRHKVIIKQGFSMEELATIYAMASIFVYPSKYEGFGIPIIEALYAGTPVITTNSGVFPEAGGPFSYYVDPENIDEISYAITSVLNNNSMREDMIHKGLAYVQQFNDEVIAKKWIQLYTIL